MIGLYGIIASEDLFDKRKRLNAFHKMRNDLDKEDFYTYSFSGNNYSIGIILRTIGEDKDLAIKEIENNFVIAFSGYGKFAGERKLYWSEDMIKRIIPIFKKDGKNALIQIEGSFQCLIYYNEELIIVSDRFGSKNLFYYETKNMFVFAPDVGKIVTSNLIPKEKNIDAAKQFLISTFFIDDATLVKGIFRFPYATILTKGIHETSPAFFKRYWNIPKNEGDIDEITPELIEAFSSKMEQAIYELIDLEEHAIVGLSGGLDSRTIACFLSEKQTVNAVSYGKESSIARRICKALNAEFSCFSNNMFNTQNFKKDLKKLVVESKIHAVVNQYIHCPSFKQYFSQNSNIVALFDGIYMDILFSGPYVFPKFEYNDFLRTYGGAGIVLEEYSKIRRSDLFDLMKRKYYEMSAGLDSYDSVGKSEVFYLNGRLRRYVLESPNSRDNYCYVLKPGFNYELGDFAYKLSLRIRKGMLYNQMLFEKFPDVMKVKYKDSYHNRKRTMAEELIKHYSNMRYKLSTITNGRMMYHTDETNEFFLGQNGIDDYKDLFLSRNCISELFDDSQMLGLINMAKKKQYLFSLFQMVLLLNQFYSRYNF